MDIVWFYILFKERKNYGINASKGLNIMLDIETSILGERIKNVLDYIPTISQSGEINRNKDRIYLNKVTIETSHDQRD